MRRIPVSSRRARRESGNEMIEFALFFALLGPLLLWVFVSGINLIRTIEASQVCRDVGNLYIHGTDYSTAAAQNTAYYLAQGFGLQLSSGTPPTASFTGNNSTNDTNAGTTTNPSNGWIVLSEIMYVGTNACSALPSGTTCTNSGKYVFLQRIDFGNKNVTFNGSAVASALGAPSGTAAPNSYGNVTDYLTDANAVSSTAGNYITLGDGQVAYVCETFFASPDLGFASYPGGGMYNRLFF